MPSAPRKNWVDKEIGNPYRRTIRSDEDLLRSWNRKKLSKRGSKRREENNTKRKHDQSKQSGVRMAKATA